MTNYKNRTWIDNKGRTIFIHTMTNRWLKNIKGFLMNNFPNDERIQWFRDELKRREEKRQGVDEKKQRIAELKEMIKTKKWKNEN